ncbi:MAG: DUF2029 domain-containing protein [Chloroflexota bacterium]|nr:DUF2029 domain-containing protein [Chloroflexota bacterium]
MSTLRAAGLALVAIAAVASTGIATTRPFGYDLVAYLAAARRLTEGLPLYPLAAHETIYLGAGEYLYPPTSAVAFVPLALLPVDVAVAIWTALLVAIAAWTAYQLLRPIPAMARPWALAAYLLYLPLIAEITLGNLSLVTLAFCLAARSWSARPRSAGAALAFALGSKLLPAALPFFFVAARAWRSIAVFAVVCVAAVVATLPWLAGSWLVYLRLLLQIDAVPATQAMTLVPTFIPGVRVVLPLTAVAVAVLAGQRARARSDNGLPYAVALAALPLAAPGIWYPYLVFALPLLAALLLHPNALRVAAAAVCYAALEFPKRPDAPDIAFAGLALLIAVGCAHVVRGEGGTAVIPSAPEAGA